MHHETGIAGLGKPVSIGEQAACNGRDRLVPDARQVIWTGARALSGASVTRIILRDDTGDAALRIGCQGE